MSNKTKYDYTFSGFKKDRTKALIKKAYEKCLVEWSSDAPVDNRGVSPYWVCVEKLEEFIDFVIQEYDASRLQALKDARVLG